MLIVSTFKVDVKTSYLVRSLYSLINILLIDVSEKLLTFSSIVPAIRPSFAQVYSGKYDCFSEMCGFFDVFSKNRYILANIPTPKCYNNLT